MAKKSTSEQIAEADLRCNRYLADANEALERGAKAKAYRLFERSGRWRDRFNQLSGNN